MGSSPLCVTWRAGPLSCWDGAMPTPSAAKPSLLLTAVECCAHFGLSEHEFRRACASGRFRTVRRGFYTPAVQATPEQIHLLLVRASARALGPDAVISHLSAAVAWGLPVTRSLLGRAWFTQRGTSHGRSGRTVKVVGTTLEAAEITEHEGLRLTAPTRTVVDTSRVSPLEWGVAIADAALHDRLTTSDALARAAAAASWRTGVARAVQAVEFADPLAQSPLESISRLQIARSGLPTPVLQRPIYLDGRKVATVDFAWPEFGVVGECDGMGKYHQLLDPGDTPQAAIMREKRREELIRQAGWWIVRWDFALAMRPELLAARLRDAFEFGRPRA